jgi:CRP-like cAMP-binding protein
MKKGRKARYGYLIKSGIVDIYIDNHHIYEAKRGDFLASIDFSGIYHHHNCDAYSRVLVEAFRINLSDLRKLMDKNPGIKIKLIKLNPFNHIL